MTAIELARAVKEMRDAQRRYYRQRNIQNLEESKRLERRLDAIVTVILEDRPAFLPFGEDA